MRRALAETARIGYARATYYADHLISEKSHATERAPKNDERRAQKSVQGRTEKSTKSTDSGNACARASSARQSGEKKRDP